LHETKAILLMMILKQEK